MSLMRRICALALVMVMLCFMSACRQPRPNAGFDAADQEKGATLTVLIPSLSPDDPGTWQYEVFENFRSQYPDVKLEFMQTTWTTWEERLKMAYSFGDHVDVIYNGVNSNPLLPKLGITQPLQDYVDMDNPNLHKVTMDVCFQYEGNRYVAAAETNFGVIYYNKDMMAACNLTDPMELYKRGEWTWDNFAVYANALTDRDSGVYGFATDYPYLFYGSNLTSTLEIRDGRYTLNTDDDAFRKALKFIQDGWCGSRWQGYDGANATIAFQTTKAAMLGSFTQYESEINMLAEISDWPPINYGVIPLPAGPNNPEGLNMVHSYGYSIGAGSDCPNHAGKLIDMLIDGQAEYQARREQELPSDSVQLYREMANRMFCVNTRDSAVGGGYEIYNDVCIGYSPTQAIEMHKDKYQAIINEIENQ